jgi:hypothetical protein
MHLGWGSRLGSHSPPEGDLVILKPWTRSGTAWSLSWSIQVNMGLFPGQSRWPRWPLRSWTRYRQALLPDKAWNDFQNELKRARSSRYTNHSDKTQRVIEIHGLKGELFELNWAQTMSSGSHKWHRRTRLIGDKLCCLTKLKISHRISTTNWKEPDDSQDETTSFLRM